jgi:3-deoxy-D-manno-octulosonate 8-phosphate phosphatase (KDO 8-P phosphatase)
MLGEAFEHIKTFIFDVDGVLTDGSLLVMPNGELLRTMNAKDGYALQLAVTKGYNVIIISGGSSESVAQRLVGLGVTNAFFNVKNKLEKFKELVVSNSIDSATTLFMGDDMPDLEILKAVYLPCAPADACVEILENAQYISPINGGQGAARDVIEKVLKLKGDWE